LAIPWTAARFRRRLNVEDIHPAIVAPDESGAVQAEWKTQNRETFKEKIKILTTWLLECLKNCQTVVAICIAITKLEFFVHSLFSVSLVKNVFRQNFFNVRQKLGVIVGFI
jgi:hypothetical protein